MEKASDEKGNMRADNPNGLVTLPIRAHNTRQKNIFKKVYHWLDIT